MRVNHNMTAVRTNLNLNRTNAKLDTSTYRLSSGYKINAAKDDPAGYAILRRMNQQIRGLGQADTNAADGVSAINTAEGALTEIQSMLQRMNELATQAANDSNTPEDRDNIQDEIKQLKEEIDRVAESTDYNGRTLLNGETERTSYVSVANGNLASSISILSQSTTVMPGEYEIEVTSDPEKATVSLTLQAGTFELNGESITITDEEINDGTAYEKVQTVCDRCSVELNQEGTSLILTTEAYGAQASLKVTNNENIYSDNGADVVATITSTSNGFSDNVVMSIESNIIVATDTNGFELRIKTETGASEEGGVTAAVLDASTLQIQISSEADNMLELVFQKVSTETLGVDDINVRTRAGASQAIEDIQGAIDQISTIRSKLGAYENRLNYAMDNLDTQSYNVEEASSRIGDTDMAEEMTAYTELNVLEQATSTILSKANQRAETILQLLQS